MPAAAAEAPTGSHQVFAIKKYVLTRVISQITTSRTRPIVRDLRSGFPEPSCEGLPESQKRKRGKQTGANISQLFLIASSFLHLLFFAVDSPSQKPL